MSAKILISAGESSGDLAASGLVRALAEAVPGAEFFGCAGPRLRAEGVRPVIRMESLNVVGLVEVLAHIPRIYGEFRKLRAAALAEKPDLAILTDSPDFNLRLAPHLRDAGIPVVYLVAPQVWAWRKGRIKTIRAVVDHLLCIFPFEEEFFRNNRVTATYIGHPQAGRIVPKLNRKDYRHKLGIADDQPLIALLPGSRPGEAKRHLPALADAVRLISENRKAAFVAGTPPGFSERVPRTFWERFPSGSIQVEEGLTWDLLAAADLALAASGTVTVEAALLGCPMVTFYKVTALSWLMGKLMLRVPFYTMVNLVAGKKVVPELMQQDMTGNNLCREALRILDDEPYRAGMNRDLERAAAKLAAPSALSPMEKAVEIILPLLQTEILKKEAVHAVRVS